MDAPDARSVGQGGISQNDCREVDGEKTTPLKQGSRTKRGERDCYREHGIQASRRQVYGTQQHPPPQPEANASQETYAYLEEEQPERVKTYRLGPQDHLSGDKGGAGCKFYEMAKVL